MLLPLCKQGALSVCIPLCVCDAELKAVHDSFVEVYMKQPEKYGTSFFHDVVVPVCVTMANRSRHKGRLAGINVLPN